MKMTCYRSSISAVFHLVCCCLKKINWTSSRIPVSLCAVGVDVTVCSLGRSLWEGQKYILLESNVAGRGSVARVRWCVKRAGPGVS